MKTILNAYPKILFQLILLYALTQIASQLWINGSFFSDFDIENGYTGEESGLLMSYTALISGFMFLIAGAIGDQMKNIKNGLVVACLSIALGYLFQLSSISILSFPSRLLIYLGESLFFILILLNIAILFPIANDWKDNAFMFLLVSGLIVGTFSSIFSTFLLELGGSSLGANFLMIFSVLLMIGLAYYIWQSDNIGYEVEEEEDAEEIITDNKVLIVVTLLIIIFNSAILLISNANQDFVNLYRFGGENDYLGASDSFGPISYLSTIGVIISFFILGIGYLIKNTQYESRQLSKIKWSIILFFAFAILSAIGIYTASFFLIYLIIGLISSVSFLLFLPSFLSILTHINIDKHAGFWLGVFLGVPKMVSYGVEQLANSNQIFWYFNLGVLVILGAIFIMIKENKDLIIERLQLEESNQAEVEEEFNLIDHLIEE